MSEEGAKQGGVDSSLFFCLVIHPILKSTQAVFPDLEIHAIMDDISITGPVESQKHAVEQLIAALADVGLRVNPAKSCTLNSPELARFLGFKCAAGAKFLGAWIGNDDDTKSFLKSQLALSAPFFNSVTALSPEFATPILSKCGVPRASYIIRTHPPEVTAEYASNFDDMVVRSFCAINLINQKTIDEEHKTCMHLPIAVGGLGITSMKRIAPIAYAASLVENEHQQQRAKTRELNENLLKSLPDHTQQHLRWGRQASWIQALCPNPHYCSSISHHILWNSAALDENVKCQCGLVCKPKTFAIHSLGCTKVSGVNASSRHAAVKTAIIGFCKRNAIPVADEPVVMKDQSITRRVDVRISLPTEDVYIDLVIPTAQCKSHASKSLAAQ